MSKQSENDLSQFDAWQQLKIFQQQRNLNSTEEEIVKDSSDDFGHMRRPLKVRKTENFLFE